MSILKLLLFSCCEMTDGHVYPERSATFGRLVVSESMHNRACYSPSRGKKNKNRKKNPNETYGARLYCEIMKSKFLSSF